MDTVLINSPYFLDTIEHKKLIYKLLCFTKTKNRHIPTSSPIRKLDLFETRIQIRFQLFVKVS